MDIKRVVGQNIRRLRRARGWSQTELGERLALTKQQVYRIETGETGTSLARIQELAELFGVSYGELFALPESEQEGPAIPVDEAIGALPADVVRVLEERDGRLTIHIEPEWRRQGIPPADFAQILAGIYLALHRAGLDRPETGKMD